MREEGRLSMRMETISRHVKDSLPIAISRTYKSLKAEFVALVRSRTVAGLLTTIKSEKGGSGVVFHVV